MMTSDHRQRLRRLESRFPGVVTGIVVANQDPEGMGRVRVRFPWIHEREGRDTSAWARVARPIAGPGYGLWAPPQIGEEVLVAFEFGDLERPMVVGRLWNGVDLPPDSEIERRVEVTREGWRLDEVTEIPGQHRVRHFVASAWEWVTDITGKLFRWTDGKSTVGVDAESGEVTMQIEKTLTLTVGGCTVVIDGEAGTVLVQGSASVTLDGPEIFLGDGASEGVPLGTSLKDWLDNHVHPDAHGGTTGAPTTESPDPSSTVKVVG